MEIATENVALDVRAGAEGSLRARGEGERRPGEGEAVRECCMGPRQEIVRARQEGNTVAGDEEV